MRYFVLGFVLVSLLAAPANAQPGSAAMPATSVWAVLVDADARGRILAVAQLEAPASEGVQGATHAALRIGPRRVVFAVARVATVGSPIGSTLVRLRGGSLPVSEVVALIVAALAGKTDLAILTQGTLETGIVTAIAPLLSEPLQVSTDGATQATIIRGGQETTVAVGAGRAGPTRVPDGSEGGRECRFCEGMGGAR